MCYMGSFCVYLYRVARPIMLQSGLPVEALKKVWDLADIDKDGYLDQVNSNRYSLSVIISCDIL